MLWLNFVAENGSDYRLRDEHRPHILLETVHIVEPEHGRGEANRFSVVREDLWIRLERVPVLFLTVGGFLFGSFYISE